MLTRKQWIDALRSDIYVQGKGQLRVGDSFCCLGVACDLADNSKWGDCDVWGTNLTHLPESLKTELGLSVDQCIALMIANDQGKSFKEIADMIESYA